MMADSQDAALSLDEIESTHDALLFRRDGLSSPLDGTPEFWADVNVFLEQARKSGMFLDRPRDRRTAQGILDYWASALVRAGKPVPDLQLEIFDATTAPILKEKKSCPYQGLEAFTAERSDYFFGRESLVEDILQRMKAGQRSFLVTGASGSGKSSLIRAGLIPRLTQGEDLPGSECWHYVTMVPGHDPAKNLNEALRGSATAASAGDKSRPNGPETTDIQDQGARVVIVVDQFEEVFTLGNEASREARRNEFVGCLYELVQERGALALFTIRDDYVNGLQKLPEDYASWILDTDARILVEALSLTELRSAIEKPAEMVGLRFDDGIVDDLAGKVLGQTAGLPLLQFTLLRLWDNLDRNRITKEDYEKVGDPLTSLQKCADEFYESLIPQDKKLVEQIFARRLVNIEEGKEATSKRTELRKVFELDDPVPQEDIARILVEMICEKRLIKLSSIQSDPCRMTKRDRVLQLRELARAQDQGAVPQIEVAHEALIRNWEQLQEWLKIQRKRLAIRHRLEARAAEWIRLGKGEGGLLDAVELREAETWMASTDAIDVGYNETVTRLIERSRAGIQAAELEKQAVMQREIQQQQELVKAKSREIQQQQELLEAKSRASSARAIAIGFLIITIVLLLTAIGIVLLQLNGTQTQIARNLASYAQVDLNTHPQRSLLLAAEAWKQKPWLERNRAASNASEETLHEVLASTGGLPWQVPNSPTILAMTVDPTSDEQLITGGDNGLVYRWTVDDSQVTGEILHDSGLAADVMAFSPDGQWWVEGSDTGSLRLRRIGASEVQPVPEILAGDLGSAVFSPDSHWLAVYSKSGSVALWKIGDPTATRLPVDYASDTRALTFNPDGKKLATGSESGKMQLWRVDAVIADAANVKPYSIIQTSHKKGIGILAWSPKKERILTVGRQDRKVELWNLEDLEKPVGSSLEFTGDARSATFSPNGDWLAIGADTGEIWLWRDLLDPDAGPSILRGHEASVSHVRFSSDGNWLFSADDDGFVRKWSTRSWAADPIVLALPAHYGNVVDMRFSPDSKRLAIWSFGESTKWLDIASLEFDPVPLMKNVVGVAEGALSIDTSWMVARNTHGTLLRWNLNKPDAQPVTLTKLSDADANVAFTTDGRYVAIGGSDSIVTYWDIANPNATPRQLSGHEGSVGSIAVSTTGDMVAIGGQDGSIRFWDMNVSSPRQEYPGRHAGSVESMVYSPNGRWLVTGSSDGQILLWDTNDLKDPEMLFERKDNSVTSLAWNLDSTLLAAGWKDGSIQLWENLQRSSRPILLTGHPASIKRLVFSNETSTSRWLASTDEKGIVRLWHVQPRELIDLACRTAGRNLVRPSDDPNEESEWQEYLSHEEYRATCLDQFVSEESDLP